MISLIAALAPDRLIGADGDLPWRLPADLKRFKRRTMGKPIVMGRATWASIGRPLPGRRNVVLSRRPGYAAAGAEVFAELDAALAAVGDAPEVMVIGGAGLYAATLPRAGRLYLTLVRGAFTGDTWFPPLGAGWRVAERADFAADDRNRWAHTEFVLERGDGPWPAELVGWR